MSKKKTQAKQQPKPEQPAYMEELLTKGTVILRAASRDEFGEMIDTIPASVRYAAGAIGKNRTSGLFELRLDIIND
jgi:hypothetical protein